jgi:hypothetical protein
MNLGKRGSIKSLVIPLIVIADSTPSRTQGEFRPWRAIKASQNFFPAASIRLVFGRQLRDRH